MRRPVEDCECHEFPELALHCHLCEEYNPATDPEYRGWPARWNRPHSESEHAMTDDRLLIKEVARIAGLRTETIRVYRARGMFPVEDGKDFGHPWWRRETVDAWVESRRMRGGSDAP